MWTRFIYILLASPVHAHQDHTPAGESQGGWRFTQFQMGDKGCRDSKNTILGEFYFVIFQLLSWVWLLATTMDCNPPVFPVLHYLLGFCSNSKSVTISSSVTPFSSCSQSFPASGSFPVSWLFTSGGQSIRASASSSVLPVNIQSWFPLGLTGLISLLSKGLSRVFSNTTVPKHWFFWLSAFLTEQLSHPYMTTGTAIALTRWTFVSKVMSLHFNILSRFVIAFLPGASII